MPGERPLVFIGSSKEGLSIAKAVQAELDYSAECMIWHQGVFGLNKGNLECLVESLGKFDFAILVLTPDDLVESRGDTRVTPRDNVLLELGIFIGGLGRNRTFMIVDRSAELKLPSDLAGITPATFQPPDGGTYRSAVGAACTEIGAAICQLGRKNSTPPISISGSHFEDSVRGSGISLKIINSSRQEFPPYQVWLAHPSGGSWSIFPSVKSGSLLPEQVREHRCIVLQKSGEIPLFVQSLHRRRDERTEFDFNLFRLQLRLEDSEKVLFEHQRYGPAIAKIIAEAGNSTSRFGDTDAWNEFWKANTNQDE